jgi:hypothetical protein
VGVTLCEESAKSRGAIAKLSHTPNNPQKPTMSERVKFIFRHILARSCLQVLIQCTGILIIVLPEEGHAFDLAACSQSPLTQVPEPINLLAPIDSKLINCVPGVAQIQSRWLGSVRQIQNAMGNFAIGNKGKAKIEKLEYYPSSKLISLQVSANAAHRWTRVKECLVPRMETTYSTVKECASPRIVQVCGKWVTIKNPFTGKTVSKECIAPYPAQEGCNRWVEARVPSGTRQVGCNKWLDEPVEASAKCSYYYRHNISTRETRPQFGCNIGVLGEYKIDASAVTALLNGEVPSLGSLLNSVSITPPLFKDANYDSYTDIRSKTASRFSSSDVYFSSESFVNWASAENQGVNIILAALTGGGYSAEFTRQLYHRLQAELLFMAPFLARVGVSISADELLSLLKSDGSTTINNYRIAVRSINVPMEYQKCMIWPVNECVPSLRSPRLGFYIVASRRP